MVAPVANYGMPILPNEQSMTGTLLRFVKVVPSSDVGNVPYLFEPVNPSLYALRMASASNKATYTTYENNWLSITNNNSQATPPENFGEAGYCFRLHPRIDKGPWPHGQEYVNVLVVVDYQESVGGGSPPSSSIGGTTYTLRAGGDYGSVAAASGIAYIQPWYRNTVFKLQVKSNPTPASSQVQSENFPAGGTCTIPVTLYCRSFDTNLLVDQDTNAFDPTNVEMFLDTPTFSYTADTFNYTTPTTRDWTMGSGPFQPGPPNLRGTAVFGDGFVGGINNFFTRETFINHQAIGLVQSVSVYIAAWGWSPEVNDSGTTS